MSARLRLVLIALGTVAIMGASAFLVPTEAAVKAIQERVCK